MTFWQLKYKFHSDEDVVCEEDMFFENPEEAMAFILDNRNKYGVDIFDIHLAERCTAIWKTRIVLNGKEEA
jgi:hypothetical protein